MTSYLLHQADLLQIRDENRDSAERGYRSLGLTQNHPLAGEQSCDFLRNQFVRGLKFHSPLSQGFTRQVHFIFGIQDKEGRQARARGLEYQLADDHNDDAASDASRVAGSLYSVIAPVLKLSPKIGE